MARDSGLYRLAYIMGIMLLLFNGAGAVYGGYGLIVQPDGSSIGLDTRLLQRTPFHNFLVPGIVLLIINGFIDLVVLVLALFRVRSFYNYIVLQGVLLLGWLVIQVMLIRVFDRMHIIMGATAILLICSGTVVGSLSKRAV